MLENHRSVGYKIILLYFIWKIRVNSKIRIHDRTLKF